MVNPINNERKNLIKRTTCNDVKPAVLLFTSLLFLVAGLIYTPVYLHPVFAAAPSFCFQYNCPDRVCDNNPQEGTATCCWSEEGVLTVFCQTCEVNTQTGDFENCNDVHVGSRGQLPPSIPPSGVAPPPSGVAPPPPSTTTCPENTVVDANGNCAPLTQGPKESPPSSTDQGTTQPPDNTASSKQKLPKGGDLLVGPPTEDNKPSKHKLPKDDRLAEPSTD